MQGAGGIAMRAVFHSRKLRCFRLPSSPAKATGAITDDTRVRAACPTLKYLVDNGAKVLLTSHLVRAMAIRNCTS